VVRRSAAFRTKLPAWQLNDSRRSTIGTTKTVQHSAVTLHAVYCDKTVRLTALSTDNELMSCRLILSPFVFRPIARSRLAHDDHVPSQLQSDVGMTRGVIEFSLTCRSSSWPRELPYYQLYHWHTIKKRVYKKVEETCMSAVAAICHKSWGSRSRPSHLSPSFNPPFFPSLSWTLQGVWLTRCQTFWCNLYSQTAL